MRKLWWVFSIILGLTVVAQVFIPIKGKFPLESTFGFAAWYGFFACVAMVLVAKVLGWWLKRPEGYYAEDDLGPCYTASRSDTDGQRDGDGSGQGVNDA